MQVSYNSTFWSRIREWESLSLSLKLKQIQTMAAQSPMKIIGLRYYSTLSVWSICCLYPSIWNSQVLSLPGYIYIYILVISLFCSFAPSFLKDLAWFHYDTFYCFFAPSLLFELSEKLHQEFVLRSGRCFLEHFV